MSFSRNAALHAVRLVLYTQPRLRAFATAAVDYSASVTAEATAARSEVIDRSLSFLETEDAEYRTVALVPRDNPSPSIPWPTIFPHAPPASDTAARDTHRQQLQCDVLAHFIHMSDLESATRVLQELRENHVPIHHRSIYLHAALLSLASPAAAGQEKTEFLRWFELYPNRWANKHSAKAAATWEPITAQLVQSYTDDAAFLSDVILLGAKKGLLPMLMPTLFKHVTTIISPKESLLLLERTLAVYKRHTTSQTRQSMSKRAVRVAQFVKRQCETYRGKHLQYLARAGWKQEAKAVFAARRGWDGNSVAHLAKVFEPAVESSVPRADPYRGVLEQLPLPRQIRAALHRPDVTPSQLSTIQGALRARPSLLARFEHRFTFPANHTFRYRGQTWLHGLILSYSNAGKHAQAIELFQRHYVWYGLPPLPAGDMKPPIAIKRRKTPSIQIITSLLPSVLASLPAADAADYLKAYTAMHPTLPPALRPSPISHLTLTKHALLHPTPGSVQEPTGTPAHGAVLCALAGQHAWPSLEAMLKRMETDGPDPNERTYTGLIAVLLRMGETDRAKEVLGRLRVRFGDAEAKRALATLKV